MLLLTDVGMSLASEAVVSKTADEILYRSNRTWRGRRFAMLRSFDARTTDEIAVNDCVVLCCDSILGSDSLPSTISSVHLPLFHW